VVGERQVPGEPEIDVDHLTVGEDTDGAVEVERDADRTREVVRRPQRQQAERDVAVGEQPRSRAERTVAAPGDEQVRLQVGRRGQARVEFARPVDRVRGEQREPGRQQPRPGALVEPAAPPGVGVDDERRPPVLPDGLAQLPLGPHRQAGYQ
jgi:hypothetical protein